MGTSFNLTKGQQLDKIKEQQNDNSPLKRKEPTYRQNAIFSSNGTQIASQYNNEDLDGTMQSSTVDTWSVMDVTMDKVLGYHREGIEKIKIKEVIGHIEKIKPLSELRLYRKEPKEERMEKKQKKKGGFEIEVPGFGYNGTEIQKVKDYEKLMAKPKKDTPMTILIQEQFLKDQSKIKNAESKWFDKLEAELERMEMDEQLHKFQSASEQATPTLHKKEFGEEIKSIQNGETCATPKRPNAMDVLGNDKQSAKESQLTPLGRHDSSDHGPKFDMGLLKSCIKRIHVLDKTQNDRAMQATARNRKMKNLNESSQNMTIGQAYFNLNKTSPSSKYIYQTTRNSSKRSIFGS